MPRTEPTPARLTFSYSRLGCGGGPRLSNGNEAERYQQSPYPPMCFERSSRHSSRSVRRSRLLSLTLAILMISHYSVESRRISSICGEFRKSSGLIHPKGGKGPVSDTRISTFPEWPETGPLP